MISALEILYIVIAFAILWVTLFLCWFIYQVAMMIRAVNLVLQEATETLARLEHALNGMKSRFDKSGKHLGRMADHMKDAAGRMADKIKR